MIHDKTEYCESGALTKGSPEYLYHNVILKSKYTSIIRNSRTKQLISAYLNNVTITTNFKSLHILLLQNDKFKWL